jgi:hypothetical protein
MKKLSFTWVFAMILASTTLVISCGKDNKTDAGQSTSNNNNNSGNTPITGTPTPSTSIDIFITNIENGAFSAPRSDSSTFLYRIGEFNRVQSGFYFYCNIPIICNGQNNSGSSVLDTFQRKLNGSSVDRDATDDTEFSSNLTTLKSQLASLVRTAKANSTYQCTWNGCYQELHYRQMGTNSYAIFVNNVYYIIDLSKPLAANPIYRQDNGTRKIYQYVQEF